MAGIDGFQVPSPLRRRLLQSLALGLLPGFATAQPAASGIKLHKLNNFSIRVSDPGRTVAFYQALFGMPVQSRWEHQVNLKVGSGTQFMGVRPLLPGEAPGITHIGYSIEDYDPDDLKRRLIELGYQPLAAPPSPGAGLDKAMKTWSRRTGDWEEVYFADARGLEVQLSPTGYCGGPDGTNCQAPASSAEGLLTLDEINHFTAFVNDGDAANEYYQRTFGLRPQAWQGPGSPVIGIGDDSQFVMYAGPFPGMENAPANIHHASFNMRDFSVEAVTSALEKQGIRPRGDAPTGPLMHYISLRMPERGGAEGGTPELYFTDPDGILMQLQDTSYCGGGGKLGEICLADGAV